MKASIFTKFTTHAKAVLHRAHLIASGDPVTPEHLAESLFIERGSLASELLHKLRPNPSENEQLPALDTTNRKKIDAIRLHPETRAILVKAVIVSSTFNHSYIGTEHLLFAMTQTDSGKRAVEHCVRVAPDAAQQQLQNILKSTSKFQELTSPFSTQEKNVDPKQKTPALDFFTTDLTSSEQQKRIDPVIGREPEIERLIHILARRNKNNPVLVGEAGVGKTAIVEGLARRIVEGAVPESLAGKRIVALDVASLVAGTVYRGEFESRIRQVIDEIKLNPAIILFIDELHTIVGAGSASGSLDAANILKPALARGEIHCIGATTHNEFRKHIETDAALERRFRPIFVTEPTRDEAIALLAGVKTYYEKFHEVTITDDALRASVDWGIRYLPDRKLPDKAIDLVDEAAAAERLTTRDISFASKKRLLEQKLVEAIENKRKAVLSENFKEAWLAKALEEKMQLNLHQIDEEEKITHARKTPATVTSDSIARVLTRTITIPIEDIKKNDAGNLANLEQKLAAHLVGQKPTLAACAKAIRRSRLGLSRLKRPIASFLFLGPSGVGKTELSKALAKTVFGNEASLIRLDMSEFSESFSVSRLIGAPAGYVGYRESGQLTEAVRRKPWSVVLFDEIEKAHPDVTALLLQILEGGILTDAVGNRVDFTNTIVILTSNIASEIFTKQAEIGFETDEAKSEGITDEVKQTIHEELKALLRPEVINRLDGLLFFDPLTKREVEQIVEREVAFITERLLTAHDITLTLTPRLVTRLAEIGFNPEEGARHIQRVITEHLTDPLTEHLMLHEGEKITRLAADDQKGSISFSHSFLPPR